MKYIYLVIITLSLSACTGNYTYKPNSHMEENLPPGVVTKQQVTPVPPSLKAEPIEHKKITVEEARNLFTPKQKNLNNSAVDSLSTFASTISARITAMEEVLISMGRRSLVITKFPFAKDTIPSKGLANLEKVDWKLMKVYRVSGHASYGGNTKKNTEYSLERASAVAKKLAKAGADMSDVTLFGLGETNRFGKSKIENQAVVIVYKKK